MQETAREESRGKGRLRATDLSFAAIPHQSKLFLDYQHDPLSLKTFYPNSVAQPSDLKSLVPAVLEKYVTDKTALCDALLQINRSAGSSEISLANIEKLRDPSCVAVLTGQQAGLFSGPLYTLYKALSAVQMADALTKRGVKAVPIFWAATEDHDFDEVSHAAAIGSDGELFETRYAIRDEDAGRPVGDIVIDSTMSKVVLDFFDDMNSSEFAGPLRDRLLGFWAEGQQFGDAFLKTIAFLFQKCGLILVDPMHPTLKILASPMYSAAVEHSDAITDSLVTRGKELESAGYHSQVLVEKDYFPLFWIDDDGKRVAVRKTGDDAFHAKGSKIEFSRTELQKVASETPERFSPGVMLRPVVQDFLFPTICYLGGSAEIAYFAQNSEVYRVLDRHVTTILHRQSFTIVEPKQERTIERYGVEFTDLFDGLEKLMLRLAEAEDLPGSGRLFAEVEENITAELDRLDDELSKIDPTIAANLATRRRKIVYHLAALKKKALLAAARNDETMTRQINALFTNLLPNGELQERSLNIFTYLNKYGPNFIDWIYDSTDIDRKDHRILSL